MSDTETIKVWIGDLGAYNGGRLVGKWFDLDEYEGKEELLEAVLEEVMEPQNKGGDWFIADVESPVSGLSAEPDLDELFEIKAALEEFDADVVSAALHEGISLDSIKDYYEGAYKDEEDYAVQLIDNMGGPGALDKQTLEMYFDYERYARDLDLSGTRVGGMLHVFRR